MDIMDIMDNFYNELIKEYIKNIKDLTLLRNRLMTKSHPDDNFIILKSETEGEIRGFSKAIKIILEKKRRKF